MRIQTIAAIMIALIATSGIKLKKHGVRATLHVRPREPNTWRLAEIASWKSSTRGFREET